MLITKRRLIDGWSEFFGQAVSFFTTLTFNWRGAVSPHAAKHALNDFPRQLDSERLGSRFYEFGHPHRTLFFFVPEKMASYPHYHGLVMAPDDSRSRHPAPDYVTFMEQCWRDVVPSGTCWSVPFNDSGALHYATKETGLNHDLSVCSLELWSDKFKRKS